MADTQNVENTKFMFENTVSPRAVTSYTLTRGVTDFTTLQQFDLYETGYSFLICLQIPVFLSNLASSANSKYGVLIDNYRHILEYEFRGAQGIEAITSETNSITNGINELNLITKVNEQAGSSFTMQYFERSGSLLTKVNELFLRGIKDPRTQIKRYLGQLRSEMTSEQGSTQGTKASAKNLIADKGFHQEIFHFLLIVTDNTALNIERAYILAACQPAQANTEIYNVTRGEISFQELSLQFNGFPISGRIVNAKAKEFLAWINANTCFDEMEYGYRILTDEPSTQTSSDADTQLSKSKYTAPSKRDWVSSSKPTFTADTLPSGIWTP